MTFRAFRESRALRPWPVSKPDNDDDDEDDDISVSKSERPLVRRVAARRAEPLSGASRDSSSSLYFAGGSLPTSGDGFRA